ncbi:MAG: hypothetical protein Q8P72_01385 [Candidatus Roizmanbacteria bacterium]|nr:hypothetical protein [Candidatus Roizmanbacteria bacterium]
MNKQFYTHLIDIEELKVDLEKIEIAPHEHQELLTIAHKTIHHIVIDIVLTELDEKEKKIFLSNLSKDDHTLIWSHLKERVENIDEKIKVASRTIIEELRRDLDEVKNSL